jgi:hypothetical protein
MRPALTRRIGRRDDPQTHDYHINIFSSAEDRGYIADAPVIAR